MSEKEEKLPFVCVQIMSGHGLSLNRGPTFR